MQITEWIQYFLIGTNWVIPALIIWLAPWKLIALYRAARRGQWLTFILFFVLLPVNTFGIVEMFYIFSWSRNGEESRKLKIENRYTNTPVEPKQQEKEPSQIEIRLPRKAIAEELATYKGPRRDGEEIKTLPQTDGVGKIDLSALSELEHMRKLAKDRGEQKSMTPTVPGQRMTVRPDIAIPRPPIVESKSEIRNPKPETNSNTQIAPKPKEPLADHVATLMPGVFVPNRALIGAISPQPAK